MAQDTRIENTGNFEKSSVFFLSLRQRSKPHWLLLAGVQAVEPEGKTFHAWGTPFQNLEQWEVPPLAFHFMGYLARSY